MDILNFLLKYINAKTLPVWIVFILIIVGIIVYEAIRSIPKLIQDNISDRREFGNTKQLQIESYFREISGDKLVKVVSEWSDMLIDTKSFTSRISDAGNLNSLIKETILYGSSKTLTLVSNFQGYNYLNMKYSNDDPLEGKSINEYTLTILCFSACIISSFKKDFSGYEIDPLFLLKLKLTDFDSMKDMFEKKVKEIESEI